MDIYKYIYLSTIYIYILNTFHYYKLYIFRKNYSKPAM